MVAMKAFSFGARGLVVVLALAAGACGHKKPREAKTSTEAAAGDARKCEVKGFSYEVPAPGPIDEARDAGTP